MGKKLLFIFLVFSSLPALVKSQGKDFETEIIGGKEQLEQILETQLYLPKVLLTSDFNTHVNLNFDLDSTGHAIHVKFDEKYNNAVRDEFTRILKFLRFKETQNKEYIPYPYPLSIHISTERYNKFIKQKYKYNLKSKFSADSSLIIYSKADVSPEFYKNGEEGMAEFILSEIEYPRLAIEKSVEGTIVIEFVVETNGYVTNINVKKSLGAGCMEEAIRLIQMTRWKPAVYQNKLVRYKMTYPITFSLRNVSRENSSSSRTFGQ